MQCLSKLSGIPNSVNVAVGRQRRYAHEFVSTHARRVFYTVQKKNKQSQKGI